MYPFPNVGGAIALFIVVPLILFIALSTVPWIVLGTVAAAVTLRLLFNRVGKVRNP
jgi:hypothetical protein